MNVKELIAEQPPEAIAAVLLDKMKAKPGDRERGMKRLMEFIEKLNDVSPVDTGNLILGIFHVDRDGEFLDACLYRKEEIAAKLEPRSELAGLKDIEGLSDEEMERFANIRDFPDQYGFELSPWNEILGYKVDVPNAKNVGAAELCAAVIWEMTFFGLDEARVEIERKNLHDSLQESEKIRELPEDEQKKYYIPAEEVYAKFGIPKRTEEEKRASHRRLCREVLTNNLRTYQALKKYVSDSFEASNLQPDTSCIQ